MRNKLLFSTFAALAFCAAPAFAQDSACSVAGQEGQLIDQASKSYCAPAPSKVLGKLTVDGKTIDVYVEKRAVDPQSSGSKIDYVGLRGYSAETGNSYDEPRQTWRYQYVAVDNTRSQRFAWQPRKAEVSALRISATPIKTITQTQQAVVETTSKTGIHSGGGSLTGQENRHISSAEISL